MVRLILVAAFVVIVIIAFAAVLGTVSAVAQGVAGKDEDTMPATFKRIAYAALVVLMLGVASGWLGSA